MNKSAAHFWQSAVDRDPDLPPRPKEISDPRYVALLLAKECSACGNSTHCSVEFALLIRLCAICRSKKAVNLGRVKLFWLVYSSPHLAPPDSGKWKCSDWCLQSEVGFVNRKIKDFKTNHGEPNPECAMWMRERRKLIAKQRQDAQDMKDWFARRKRESMAEQTQQG